MGLLSLWDRGARPEPERVLPYASLLQAGWLRLWWLFEERRIPREDRWVYERMVPYLDSPMRVQAWMYSYLKYNAWDIFDNWLRPEVLFYARNRGDCEDWSIFANACLEKRHRGFYVLMYRESCGLRYGHCSYATRVSIDPDRWVSLGTFGLQRHEGSWEDIVEDHWGYDRWVKIVVLDASRTAEAWQECYVDRTKLPEVYRVER